MKLSTLNTQPSTPPNHRLRVDLANLSEADVRFLQGLIRLFADPREEATAELLRSGQTSLVYLPGTGDLHFTAGITLHSNN